MKQTRLGMFRHIVVLGMAIMVLVSGCARGGQTPAEGTPKSGTAPAQAGPQQGGTAVWARATDPTTLDAGYAFSSEDIAPVNHIFETLVKLGNEPGKIEPLLATASGPTPPCRKVSWGTTPAWRPTSTIPNWRSRCSSRPACRTWRSR